MFRRPLVPALAVLALAACASSPPYVSPTTAAPRISEPLAAPVGETLGAAHRALVAAGYQVTSADASAGTISTTPHAQPLKDTEADCGKGEVDYLQDPATVTTVQMGVIVAGGMMTVQASVLGVYKPEGKAEQTLVCVSRGTLEQDMLARIHQQLPVHVP